MSVRSFSSTIRSATITGAPNCESRGSPSANPRAKSLPSTDYTQAQIDGLLARGVVGGPSNTDPDGAQGASGAVTA